VAPKAQLDPSAQALLDHASEKNELLSFERLHPSIAKLPSQKDAALAFAQTATFVETFYEKHGASALRQAIEEMAEGTDARDALAKVSGTSWSSLQGEWKASLQKRPEPPSNPPRVLEMRFRKGKNADESLDVEKKRARRFLRLGDLLWDRGRAGAAKVEYGKAHEAAPDDPIVSARLGRAALKAGDAKEAIQAVRSMAERHPDHAPTRSLMSAAYLAQGNMTAARKQGREAIRLNPFDPRPHCVLAAAGSDEEERRRETRICERLGGTPR
jgi:tetratricopeptide (TPR) repeat protein